MEKFFDQRNRKISNLNLISDNLGYILRENVSLFSVDDENKLATFITESGNIIEGNYYFSDKAILDNIQVESGEVFADEDKFDSASRNQISSLIDSIYSDTLSESGDIFNSILDSWTQRVKFNETIERLNEKKESFNKTFNIIETSEFERFVELSENISKFISENSERIAEIPEIRNAIRLSNTISNAFDLQRTSLEDLKEKGSVEFSLSESRDIYEMVCKQELMKREILESKKSFSHVWVTEECISNLATKIFETDEEVIKKALVEAFVEIPYISLISKKELSETIYKNLNTLHEDIGVTKNDVKEFTKILFEMKKPLKELTSNLLQEKYGINLNNIKETPTFKTLLNTQSIIFESLAKISTRGSVIRECFTKMSEMLKSKNGVQAIDVNAGMRYLFENSGLVDVYDDAPVSSNFSLTESLDDNEEMITFIMEELLSEKKDEKKKLTKPVKNRYEAVSEEEAVAVEDEEEVKDDEESSLSTKELIDTLKDIESLIGEPTDISEE